MYCKENKKKKLSKNAVLSFITETMRTLLILYASNAQIHNQLVWLVFPVLVKPFCVKKPNLTN